MRADKHARGVVNRKNPPIAPGPRHARRQATIEHLSRAEFRAMRRHTGGK